MLLVCAHEGGEHAVIRVQQGLGLVVLQDDAPLHHNHQVGVQDGVDAVLHSGEEESRSLVYRVKHCLSVHLEAHVLTVGVRHLPGFPPRSFFSLIPFFKFSSL